MSLPLSDDQQLPRKPIYFIVEHSDGAIIHINANCILKLIHEYVRLKAGIPQNLEFDLCDDEGGLKYLFEAPEGASGLDFFEHKHNYYIVLLERSKYGSVSNPHVLLTVNHRHYARVMRAVMKAFERPSDHSGVSRSMSGSPKHKRRHSKKK